MESSGDEAFQDQPMRFHPCATPFPFPNSKNNTRDDVWISFHWIFDRRMDPSRLQTNKSSTCVDTRNEQGQGTRTFSRNVFVSSRTCACKDILSSNSSQTTHESDVLGFGITTRRIDPVPSEELASASHRVLRNEANWMEIDKPSFPFVRFEWSSLRDEVTRGRRSWLRINDVRFVGNDTLRSLCIAKNALASVTIA